MIFSGARRNDFLEKRRIKRRGPRKAAKLADRALDNLKATRCTDEDSEQICRIVVLCSRAPEIAGEILPDDKELTAAKRALDDVEDDLKKMASAMDRMKTANARFQRGARAARDQCEAKVRMAYRSVSNVSAKPDPDQAAEIKPPERYLQWSGGDPSDGDGAAADEKGSAGHNECIADALGTAVGSRRSGEELSSISHGLRPGDIIGRAAGTAPLNPAPCA